MEKVEVDSSEIEPFLADIYRKLEWLEREELIKKFVSVEFNRFLDYYKNTPDLNVPEESKPGGRSKEAVEGFTRFFINLGKLDDLKPKELMGLISDFTGIRDIEIGEIKILKTFSFFEADSKFKESILKSFANKEYRKRKITLEVSQSKEKDRSWHNHSRNFKERKFKREKSLDTENFIRRKKFRIGIGKKENRFHKEKRNKYSANPKKKR